MVLVLNITPVMYIDPEGESLTLLVGFLVASLIAFCMVATAPRENNAGENISVSGSASPDAVGVQVLGVGFEASEGVSGVTYDVEGNLYETMIYGGQLGPLGASYVESFNGSNTASLSFLIFYISVNTNDMLDVDSWGAGLSFSASAGFGMGAVSTSIDIDFFGLIVDQFVRRDD